MGIGQTSAPAPAPSGGGGGGLGDLFGLSGSMGLANQGSMYVQPTAIWLEAARGKGLEVSGTFSRRQNQLYMDLTVTNRAMQPMGDFAVQFNKNRYRRK